MPPEKADALVIRQADFSESSRVVTFFTREFGKSSALAKGAKRLKGPFEVSLDLLAHVRIVLYRKDSDVLDLVTESQLIKRFAPPQRTMLPLYSGYYVAELLDLGTEPHDPHPDLFDLALETLGRLERETDSRWALLRFELRWLREIGHLAELECCSLCGVEALSSSTERYWVTPGGLVCPRCGRPEYSASAIQFASVRLLRHLAEDLSPLEEIIDSPTLHDVPLDPSSTQWKEVRRVVTAAVCHALDRRPKMLDHLKF